MQFGLTTFNSVNIGADILARTSNATNPFNYNSSTAWSSSLSLSWSNPTWGDWSIGGRYTSPVQTTDYSIAGILSYKKRY